MTNLQDKTRFQLGEAVKTNEGWIGHVVEINPASVDCSGEPIYRVKRNDRQFQTCCSESELSSVPEAR